ncbi:tannase/feruloyl esterase family alpha/beta hydrolase [Urechidicola vernalis]|uniref:Tannase/feruloyl esterase family alpha/beta hydrolase n=1 Tax=Urechidicola vernalis TaxID=3075600 RepID=A0ABU2Y4R1_9FLAO|nr:tannase/feruloyl esterase family alpha/beta hydrolase [Urechidicola sp. P050]MDT0553032.1 tannase/feruloyl esterase family alpha/beta hydrolase [Urechidicola sp. P050]
MKTLIKKTKILAILLMVFLSLGACKTKPTKTVTCETATIVDLPEVTIVSVTQETGMAPHCKIAGIIGTDIKFELLLPHDWNGKFVMGGGGGYVGSVINTALAYGVLQKGYATVGTDTGHEGHPLSGSWALNNPEAIVNFGHLGVHRTTVTAKAIIEAYYEQEIDYSYFFGCSRGGGQALMEAQRYPDDFDGIVSGAPAYDWVNGIGAGMVHNQRYMYPNPNEIGDPLISRDDLQLVFDTYMAMCDKLDGVEDGVLLDPRACPFDIESLLCEGEENGKCLSQEKVTALKAIYEGPKGENGQIFPGFPIGLETNLDGWFKWMTGGVNHLEDADEFQAGVTSEIEAPVVPNAQFGFGVDMLKYFVYHDENWDYVDYDLNQLEYDARVIAKTMNATDPDLSEFRSNGGKLLMYTGWGDMAITPLGTIAYYEDVIKNDPTAEKDVKLFMMPGVGHCFGGDGPFWVNWVDEIDNWVSGSNTPDQIAVYYLDETMQPTGTNKLCPYPQVAIYDGTGDPKDISSYSCGELRIE